MERTKSIQDQPNCLYWPLSVVKYLWPCSTKFLLLYFRFFYSDEIRLQWTEMKFLLNFLFHSPAVLELEQAKKRKFVRKKSFYAWTNKHFVASYMLFEWFSVTSNWTKYLYEGSLSCKRWIMHSKIQFMDRKLHLCQCTFCNSISTFVCYNFYFILNQVTYSRSR